MALNHLPSGRFAANGAWLSVQVIAHNLARWTARIGLDAGIRRDRWHLHPGRRRTPQQPGSGGVSGLIHRRFGRVISGNVSV
jgi:hypothetical protein